MITVLSIAIVTGLPTNHVVIELDIKVARPRVGATNQDQLEAVEFVVIEEIITDLSPVHAEGWVSVDSLDSMRVGDQARIRAPCINIGPEWRDNREPNCFESIWGECTRWVLEGNIAIVVHIASRASHPEEIDRKIEGNETSRSIIIRFNY